MQNPYLSVVIPSFNEQQNITRGVLDSVASYLASQPYTSEIILTDDGSTDGTLEKLYLFAKKHPNVRIFANNHRGKGPTVYTGMTEALGAIRLFTDFDQATPIEEIEKLLPFVHKGYDVVIGSREVEGSRRDKEPFHRHLMGKAFNFFVNLFTVQGIHDTQCGFKLFTAKAVKDLFPLLWVYKPDKTRQDAFTGAFDVELLYIARKKTLQIAEVPVFWKYAKTNRVSPLKDSARMFFDLLRIRFSDLIGKYKK